MHTYNPDELAAANPLGGYRRSLTATQAFADAGGGVAAAITGLSFPIKKGERWHFRAFLQTTGVSGGGKFSISGSSSSATALAAIVTGIAGGVTAFSNERITAVDTLSAAYNTTAATGPVTIEGCVTGAADGTISFNCANVTGSNSFSVLAGSTLIATRIS